MIPACKLSIACMPCGCNYDNNIDCWDLQGASVEKCGPMLPSVPQNLTVTSSMMNESTVILQITWQPPALYDPDIIAYRVSINDEDYCINGVITALLIIDLMCAQYCIC